MVVAVHYGQECALSLVDKLSVTFLDSHKFSLCNCGTLPGDVVRKITKKRFEKICLLTITFPTGGEQGGITPGTNDACVLFLLGG